MPDTMIANPGEAQRAEVRGRRREVRGTGLFFGG